MAGNGVTGETKPLKLDILCGFCEGGIGKMVESIVFCGTGYSAKSTFSNGKRTKLPLRVSESAVETTRLGVFGVCSCNWKDFISSS
jgi:hypothetical protein